MQEYQGISILFFSRQSKARLVFLTSKQSKAKTSCDSKMADKTVVHERENQCKAEIKETSSAQCSEILKERLAALDASNHVLQAAACGVDNKTEHSRILRGVHVPCQHVHSMGAPDHGPQLQRVVKKGAQGQHLSLTEAKMRQRGQRRCRTSFNLRCLSESRQVTLEKPVFAAGNLAKLLGGA